MMMMSQPIQPSSAGITGFGGSQGFIQGRQRLQQTPPPAGTVNTPSLPESTGIPQRNQALLNSGMVQSATVQQPDVVTTSSNTSVTRPAGSGLAYQEIQSIAEKAGYVGVSQRDIDRAYRLNKSLLVDYRA